MLQIRLFLPFAAAYFLSYHFRTANAVIGPVISEQMSLGAADLGLLTSAYFLAFGAAQLPLGVLLDRFGARRVESALLLIAAAGAALFAFGHGIGTLAIARGMIGLGVSACLMAAFKSFSQWFPLEKQAALTGWIMTSGTLGALAASAPLNAALQFATWRELFLGLSGATSMVAAWLFFGVPDKPGTPQPEPLSAQWSGIRRVLADRHFWRFAPLGFANIGGFMAIQSLWSSAWLMQVNGYSRAIAANHLAAMSIAMVAGYVLIGLLATKLNHRGVGPIRLLKWGISLALVTLLLIVSRSSDQHYLLWIAYGTFSSCGTLAYSVMSAGFPVALSGRANTTLNLIVFIGAFGLQWGMGITIDAFLFNGYDAQTAHRNAFAVLFALQAAACFWLLISEPRAAASSRSAPHPPAF